MFVLRMKQALLAAGMTAATVAGSVAFLGTPAQAADPDTGTGSAYGLQVDLLGATLLGPLALATLGASGQSATATTVPANLAPLLNVNAVSGATSSTGFGTAAEVITSTAGVAGTFTIDGVNLLNALDVQAIDTMCTSSATGSTGATDTLSISGTPAPLPIDDILPTGPGSPLAALNGLVSIELNVQTPLDRPAIDGTSMQVIGLQITLLSALDSGAVIDAAVSNCQATGADIEAPPAVSGITPTFGPADGGTSVTITGTGFTTASTVKFGTVAATSVTYVSPTELKAVSPAAVDQTANSTVDVVTTGAFGSSATAAADQFTYEVAPTINVSTGTPPGIAPTTGPAAGGTPVTITGTNFAPGDATTVVDFGTTPATSVDVVSPTEITVDSPAGTPGPVNVSVTDAGGTVTAAQQFTYTASPVVGSNGLSPAFGPIAGGTTVTLTGTGLSGTTAVTFGGVIGTSIDNISATSVSVVDPANPAGAVTVAVTANGVTANAAEQFTYVGAPTIGATGLSPTTGSTLGGTPVTITGTGFAGPTSVSFGGAAASDVTVVNSTTVTAVSPPGAAGPVTVSLTDVGGTVQATQQFTYVAPPAPPTVSGISPPSGPSAGGETVYIYGTNLCTTSSVDFGNVPATLVNVTTDCTRLDVTEPPGTGTVAVTVTNGGGTATSPINFTYIAPGYWEAASDGGVFSFGGAQFYGSIPGVLPKGEKLNSPIVAMADTPDHGGYWLFAADGGVFSFGDATFFGSVPGVLGNRKLNGPIVAAEATPDGGGYRMFAADGGVFNFGDAQFEGSLPGEHIIPNQPVAAAVSAPVGQGYWLVAGDGSVYEFGNAVAEGSPAGSFFGRVVSMAATPDGLGYYIFLANGDVISEGDALKNLGNPTTALNSPIVFGQATSTGQGYWEFASDGGVFNYGDAPYEGSLGSLKLNAPITAAIGFGSNPIT
jgi:hypothetical protein